MANSKHQITAEWTVEAKLTLTHPNFGPNYNKDENDNDDPEKQNNDPVKVVYKFSTEDDDGKIKIDNQNVTFKKGNILFTSMPPSTAQTGDGTENVGGIFNPQCTSTCSIMLTASTDLCSQKHKEAGTTTEQAGYMFVGKDACCQTSDLEVNKLVQTDDCPKEKSRRKIYDYRRATDSMLSPLMGKRKEKSRSHSPADVFSPSGTIQSRHSSSNKDDPSKKKPRTVHIDVYCTGSDASDNEGNTSSSSDSHYGAHRIQEIKSDGTQGLYETSEMKLKHKKAGKYDMPRRYQSTDPNQSTLSSEDASKKSNNKRVRKTDLKEEINESKQILFSKHLGDKTEVRDFHRMFKRNTSEDCLSSSYPFSNRTTKRDITGSSLSSALASMAVCEEGFSEKQDEIEIAIQHSDSFEYENSEDRHRIRQMENLWQQQRWRSPMAERKLLNFHNRLRCDSDSDNNLSESDHSFVFEISSKPNESLFSDSSPSTVKSYSTKHTDVSNRNKSEENLCGYSKEYLAKARIFGKLICLRRKPGNHIGPVKNPECACEHCKRWTLEKDTGPERALSTGNVPKNIMDAIRRRLNLET